MIVLNNETLKQIDELGKADQTPMIGDLVINYIGSKNPHENVTLALKSIKEDLKEILSHYPEDFYFGQIHFSILNEVFKELGWKVVYDTILTIGVDFEVTIDVPNKDFYYQLSCSWYDPKNHLRKCYEAKGNNC